MALYVRFSGAWKSVSPYVKAGGQWKPVLNVHVKRDGQWRPLWSYSWQAGGWSGCSASCGGGYQSRSVTCRRNDGVTVADGFCAGIAKPSTSQNCNTHSCYSYSWQAGSYGTCSAYCGSGTSSRSVYCWRSDGYTVEDYYCSGSKPSTSTSCTSSCYWSYSGYGGCSNTCGTGTQTRAASCYSNRPGSYSPVATSYCTNYLGAAATSQSCTSCTSCAFNENSTVNNKVKWLNANRYDGRTNWGYSEVREAIIGSYGSVQNWWNSSGQGESVCPWSSAACCIQSGYSYY